MRNNIQRLLLATAFILFALTNVKAIEPQQMGKHAFKILKNFSKWDTQTYLKQIMSLEEIHQLAKNNQLVKEESARNKILSITQNKWHDEVIDDFMEVRKEAASKGIEWRKIKYLDFIYSIEEDAGITMCKGELFFKYQERAFSIEVMYILAEDGYRLVQIDDFDDN